MSTKVKSFDVAKMVIDEASSQFGSLWALSDTKLDIFKQYCDCIDDMVDEFGATAISVDVDDINMTIDVAFECPELILEDSRHHFFDLVERSERLSISLGEGNDSIVVKFTFPKLWELA